MINSTRRLLAPIFDTYSRYEVKAHVLILTVLVVFISYKNYVPGTWFTGWDNLHPEFNFKLNIHRSFNAVWQEYQGLGLLSGMSHAADLPRELLLLVFSLVFPANFLRYLYFFLMLWFGSVGIYFLFKYLLSREGREEGYKWVAFLSGLYYLLNIGTVLNFYAPISFFNTQYGFFPWLVLLYLKCLRNINKKNLIVFILLSFFGSQMAYVATLFIVYVFVLAVLGLYEIILTKFNSKVIKNTVILALVTLIINSYWLLPFGVFVFSKTGTVINSKISQMSSENTFAINKKRGNFSNVIQLKGFWFDNLDMNDKGEFVPMFKEWNDHLNNNSVRVVGYTLSSFIIFGFLLCLLKGSKENKAFIFIFLISIVMLLSENPPVGFIFNFIRNHSSIFREIFRFTYTKFSLMAILGYSVVFGFGILYLSDIKHIRNFPILLKGKVLSIILTALFSLLLVVWVFPIFRGYLLYPRLKIKIPQEYFQLFDFFQKQSASTRVAILPQHTFWSWKYYNWGYRGSGFIWYGIPQPILDRAFDVWNSNNEGYYYEISQAIYSDNVDLLYKTLKKYDAYWVVLDKNVISASSPSALNSHDTSKMLSRSDLFTYVTTFGNIDIYSVNGVSNSSFIEVNDVSAYKNVYPTYQYKDIDTIYGANGDYTSTKGNFDLLYPFVSIGYDKNIYFYNSPNAINVEVSKKVPTNLDGYSLRIPSYSDYENYIPARIFAKRSGDKIVLQVKYLLPTISVGEVTIAYDNPTTVLNFQLPLNITSVLLEFNNEAYLEVNDLKSEFSLIGNVMLKTKKNNISIVVSDMKKDINMSETLKIREVVKCAKFSDDSYVEKKYFQNGVLALDSRNASGCINADINGFVDPNTSVIKVSFDYLSSKDERPGYCLYNSVSTICLNRKANDYGFSGSWKAFSEFINIVEKLQRHIEFGVIIEGDKTDRTKSINYKDIILKQYLSLGSVEFTPEFYEQTAALTSLTASNNEIKVTYPSVPSYNSRNFGPYRNFYNSTFGNCNPALEGNLVVASLLDDKENPFVRYSSINANLCDYNVLPRFYHDTSYLVSTRYRNVSAGIPIEICFADPINSRCVKNDYLEKATSWNTSYEIVRTQKAGDRGYSFGIQNQSFDFDQVVNDLQYVLIQPFPADWLSNLFISRNGYASPSLKNDTLVEPNAVRAAEWLYVVKDLKPNTMLVLNQSNDNSWLVFCGLLPCKYTHVEINGWANGWILDSSVPSTIYIIYWPQILEFVGLVLFAITLIYAGNLSYRS